MEETEARRAMAVVDPSGVEGLDGLLGGGLPRGALALVVGAPGSGKTTLAVQIGFAAARAGRRVLLLTALSESTTKLIAHLRLFDFFDEGALGQGVQIHSLQAFLPHGLTTTAEEIRAEVRRTRATLVVLDGFRGIRGADAQAARQFLYELSTGLDALQATTLITSEAEPRDSMLFPEVTTADVLLGIHYRLDGMRHQRHIEAIKVRGAAPLPGLHSLTLSSAGARVAARLEARVAALEAPGDDSALPLGGRAAFGLPELDALLDGGLTRDTPTLLLGSPGTGKTLLGLYFAVAGARAGEPTVLLGFGETLGELLHKGDTFALGADLRAVLAEGQLTVLRYAPLELDPDELAATLLDTLDRVGARRLIVDSVGALERAVAEGSDHRRVATYLAALIEVLRRRRITALLVKETASLTSSDLEQGADTLALMAANVVWLQQIAYRGRLHRVLSVPKMRYSAHDVALREFTISAPEGLRVLAPFQSGSEVLVGIAGQQGMPMSQEGDGAGPAR